MRQALDSSTMQSLDFLTTQTDRAAIDVRKLIKWSKMRLIFVNILPLIVLPLIVLFDGDIVFITLVALGTVPPLLFVVFQRISYRRKIERIKQLPQLPINWLTTSALGQSIEEARTSLIPDSTLDVRFSLVSDVGASVYHSNDSSLLVVTLGLINLSIRHPARSSGIIYHEMAHLLHGDTELFDFAMSISLGLEKYLICMFGIFGLLYVFRVLSGGWYNPFAEIKTTSLVPIYFTVIQIEGIRKARLTSEILADIRAATVVGASDMIDAIANCVKAEEIKLFNPEGDGNSLWMQASTNDKLHPHRELRLFVMRWMAARDIVKRSISG